MKLCPPRPAAACLAPLPLLLAGLALAAPSRAQVMDGRPVIRELRIAPGARVDLDTGVVLPRDVEHPFAADLHFDRDGVWFFLAPRVGAIRGRPEDEQAAGDGWSTERQRLPMPRRTEEPVAWFFKTDRGAVAKVTLSIVNPYSTASAVLTWALAPGGHPVFVPGPEGVTHSWKTKKSIEVSWEGDAEEYLVEIVAGESKRIVTTRRTRQRVDLAPDKLHTIGVRRLLEDGVVSLPTSISVLGTRTPARRGTVDFADRWYDTNGGLSLRAGQQEEFAPDVVFYLYGVYAPGGGVQKVGDGRRAYDGLEETPETGYLPAYGRLDERDVLAVRLADGRFAKLMLEPHDGEDVRDGMRVHFAWLAGGGRQFLSRPAVGTFKATQGGLDLSWERVKGAVAYRVQGPGGAVDVQEVRGPRLRIARAERERLHPYEVRAVDALGSVSDPLVIEAHTFPDDVRIGQLVLRAGGREGYSFSADEVVAHRAAAGLVGDPALEIVITNSAGGASSLEFTTPHGSASPDGLPFGIFPPVPGRVEFSKTHDTDDRRPASELFWVRTRDGGVACVRIRGRDYPSVTLDYIWRPGKR